MFGLWSFCAVYLAFTHVYGDLLWYTLAQSCYFKIKITGNETNLFKIKAVKSITCIVCAVLGWTEKQ